MTQVSGGYQIVPFPDHIPWYSQETSLTYKTHSRNTQATHTFTGQQTASAINDLCRWTVKSVMAVLSDKCSKTLASSTHTCSRSDGRE